MSSDAKRYKRILRKMSQNEATEEELEFFHEYSKKQDSISPMSVGNPIGADLKRAIAKDLENAKNCRFLLVHAPDKDFARPILFTHDRNAIIRYLNDEHDRVKENYMVHLFTWDKDFNGWRQKYRFYWWRNNRFEDADGTSIDWFYRHL